MNERDDESHATRDAPDRAVSKQQASVAHAAFHVLFVCVENSNRSQMAEALARIQSEAFAREHGGMRIAAFSAGSKPSGTINPKAIESMHELGYDLSKHTSKSLDDLPNVTFDAAVTMGCGDACPNVRARVREEWNIPDPKNMSPDEFRAVRDEIAGRVRRLLAGLGDAM